LRRLEDLGWISADEAKQALEEQIEYKHTPNKAKEYNRAPYFVSNILFSELLPKYGKTTVYKGGLEVHTTLDLKLQEAAIKAVEKLQTEGALIALDPSTGEILAMVGGKNFSESKFNRAVQAYRQPGSAFKPFVYAAAFENGIMPIDHILDAPISFDHQGPDDKVWAPGNYSGKYHGEVTIIEALTHSYNTVSVRTAEMIGIEPVLSMARRTGITSQYLPHDLSASLGTASITPLELAIAYSTFANGGKRVAPYSIRYIEDRTGQILESQDPMVVDAISARTAVVMRSMLMDVVRAGTGRRCSIPGYEVFGKTGTTNEYMDAWFAGGAPGLVTIVYAGNDDHSTIGNKATGGKIAGPVWKDFMSRAVDILELPKKFDIPPEGELQMVRVCRDTGYLATPGCPGMSIYLPPENIPESTCPKHGGDYYQASIDPRAPRVLLLPDDEALYSKYRQPSGIYDALPEMADNIPVIEQPVIKENKAPIPPSEEPAPYERDYSSPEQVEQRYQDLLKQYGISD
jgi:penicillin-binding protein 1A